MTDTMVMFHDGDLRDLAIEDDDGAGMICTTDEHTVWSITDDAWVPAIELDEGDLTGSAKSTAPPPTVTGVDERPRPPGHVGPHRRRPEGTLTLAPTL